MKKRSKRNLISEIEKAETRQEISEMENAHRAKRSPDALIKKDVNEIENEKTIINTVKTETPQETATATESAVNEEETNVQTETATDDAVSEEETDVQTETADVVEGTDEQTEAAQNETAEEKATHTEIVAEGKKKSRGFKKFYKIFVAVLSLLSVLFLVGVWIMAAEYQSSLPETYAMSFLENTDEKIGEVIDTALLGKTLEFENNLTVTNRAKELAASGVSCTKFSAEYTAEEPVFVYKCGDTLLAKISLERADTTLLFKFGLWEIKSADIDCGLLAPRTARIVVPFGASVTLGGIAVGEEYISNESPFSRFEGAGDAPQYTLYKIDGLYAPPEVTAEFNGDALSRSDENKFDILFDYKEGYMRPLEIIVPAGARISAGGVEVGGEYMTDERIFYPEGQFDIPSEMPCAVKYVLPRIINTPVVTATYKGEEIFYTADDKYSLNFAYPTKDYRICAPAGAEVYVSGVKLTDEYVSSENSLWGTMFDCVKPRKLKPSGDGYKINGLYTLPSMSAMLDGMVLVCEYDAEAATYIFLPPASDALKTMMSKTVDTFMKSYITYTSKGYRNINANYADVLSHTLSLSSLETKIEKAKNGFSYIEPSAVSYEYLESDNYISFGEYSFTCTVKYKINLSNYLGERVNESNITLVFVKEDNKWLCADLIIND